MHFIFLGEADTSSAVETLLYVNDADPPRALIFVP